VNTKTGTEQEVSTLLKGHHQAKTLLQTSEASDTNFEIKSLK